MMNIVGRIVILRAMEKSDCDMVKGMFNDPEIEDRVVGWAFPLSSYAQEQWYINHYQDQINHRFIIETIDDGPVGVATLIGIDWKNRRATHGIKIASKEYRAKGIGTDAVMAIMRYAFDELGLKRLDAGWFEDNIASKRLYTKCGWVVEGIRRQYYFKKGLYRDMVVAGILESEYRTLIEKNHYWDGNVEYMSE